MNSKIKAGRGTAERPGVMVRCDPEDWQNFHRFAREQNDYLCPLFIKGMHLLMQQQEKYSLRGLLAEREALDAQIAEMRAEMREAKLAEARALVEEFDLTAYELGLVKTQHIVKRGRKEARTFQAKATPQPREPLYRDPATGATWSGRGRPPLWIDGQADDYLIKGRHD